MRGGSFPPPLESAAALRAEITFAGGFVGRERLGTSLGWLPETGKVRTFVPRGVGMASVAADCVPVTER